MTRNAEQAASAAEADDYNTPGYCLQQTRTWADIAPRYTTATIAWQNAERRQLNRNGRRGAFAFFTGGSKGYGHIAMMLSDESDPLIRSTDAGGSGRVATRRLSWFDANWPSLNFVGWTDNVNGVTVPGVMGDWFDMATEAELRAIVREEIATLKDDTFINRIAKAASDKVLGHTIQVTVEDKKVKKTVQQLLRETFQRVTKV